MPYYTEEQIKQARLIDLMTYLQTYEPTELVHVRGNTWCLREHDSLKLSNGKWFWWSRGFGGRSALDYLTKVKGLQFMEAMKILTDEGAIAPIFVAGDRAKSEPPGMKELVLPEQSASNREVMRYLQSRGIERDIIRECINEGLIYESLPYHNCVFVGYNESGKPAYACYRAIGNKRIMGDAKGSDKRYAFRVPAQGRTVHVFESAIDLLSFATLLKMKTGIWRAEPMVSLGGVYAPSINRQGIRIPAALDNFLHNNNGITTVALHLDSDEAGRGAAKAIAEQLSDRYVVIDDPPPIGKDCLFY